MHNHRLQLIILLICLLAHLIFTFECNQHLHDIPFSTKVHQSPVIVIGISLTKNLDPNIQNLFNVTFLVECILKGRPTERIIHIVQAGSLLGRRSCQRLDIDQECIVFLEPFFDGTYRPVDFEDIPHSNQINVLLEKTCGLSRTYPFTEVNDTDATLTNKCPSAVSLDCPLETSKNINGSSTRHSALTTTTNATLVGSNPLDLEVLSLLLADYPPQNYSFDFSQSHNHKSLFSDDEARKNDATRLALMLFTPFLLYSIHLIVF